MKQKRTTEVTGDLFEESARRDRIGEPLAERMRPIGLDEFVGQQHIIGEGKLLRRAIEGDRLFSMVFWGPPGSGKTTLARLIASATGASFVPLSTP